MNAREQGLFHKFNVTRTDGADQPGGTHHGDEYFVLNLTTDRHTLPAIAAYAQSCETAYPALAADLRARIAEKLTGISEFVIVPETVLPNGTIVPTFQASRYLMSPGIGDTPLSVADAAPWVNINYHDARATCVKAGGELERETQALAIAWNVSQQGENWSGGKVGEGVLFMGLHKGTVSSAQPGAYESPDPDERRWFVLSNGERICDVAGNAYRWIFDDVQGDEKGVIARNFAKDSISITTPPYPNRTKGMGDYTVGNWSGHALIRGGCWHSGADAGAFYLSVGWPGYRGDYVGFRCTQPGL